MLPLDSERNNRHILCIVRAAAAIVYELRPVVVDRRTTTTPPGTYLYTEVPGTRSVGITIVTIIDARVCPLRFFTRLVRGEPRDNISATRRVGDVHKRVCLSRDDSSRAHAIDYRV